MSLWRPVILGCLVVAGLSVSALAQTPSVKGAWRVVEVTDEDGKLNPKPEPGLYIFTDRHYSIMRVVASRPQLPPKPTEKDIAATFGPFIANAGTYQVKGTQLMMQPAVAKNPAVMMGKGLNAEMKMEGANTVSITGPGKTIVKLQRVE